jgi:hypothetical protein
MFICVGVMLCSGTVVVRIGYNCWCNVFGRDWRGPYIFLCLGVMFCTGIVEGRTVCML